MNEKEYFQGQKGDEISKQKEQTRMKSLKQQKGGTGHKANKQT